MSENDEELRLAMEISKRTFEEEERMRKANDLNLISFESPEEVEQTKKITSIQNMINHQTYGWRTHATLPAATPQMQNSASFSNFPPQPVFRLTPGVSQPPIRPRGSTPVLPPPLPPRSHPHTRHEPSHSTSTPNFASATLPPPQTSILSSGPRNTLDAPIPHPGFPAPQRPGWKMQFSPNPSYRSVDYWKLSDVNSNCGPSNAHLEPARVNELYIPYAMLCAPKSTADTDLIDLNTPGTGTGKATLDQIRREFDPLYDLMPHNANVLERTKSLRSENAETVTRTSPAKLVSPKRSGSVDAGKDYKAHEWLNIDNIKMATAVPAVQDQISKLRKRWRANPSFVRKFHTPIADYMTTSADRVKVEVHKDHTCSKGGRESYSGTVDTSITTEMLLTEVLTVCLDENDLKNGVPTEEYGLKVYGLDEFLPSSSLFGQNLYVGKCLLLGKDVKLEVGRFGQLDRPSDPYTKTDLAKNKTHVPSPSVLDAEDIQNLLLHLKEEMRRFDSDALENNQLSIAATSNKVRQFVKLLCKMLNGIEPVSLHRHLQKYLTAGGKNDLENSRNDFIASVHSLISAFSRSTLSLTAPVPLKETSAEKKVVFEVSDKLRIMVNSLHCIREEWLQTYSHFYVTVHIYHGTQQIDGHAVVFPRDVHKDALFPYVDMNIYAAFNTEIRLCPREAKLMFILWGIRKEPTEAGGDPNEHLAVASVPIFDHKQFLRQGQLFVPLSAITGPILQPWRPVPLINSERDAVLMVTFPTNLYNIYFPDVTLEATFARRDLNTLDADQQAYLMDLVETIEPEKLSSDDREALWQRRHYLGHIPEALPLVLASVPSWGYGFLSNVYVLLEEWTPLSPEHSIQLLLPQYPDVNVRTKAVNWIKQASSDFLFNFLPQLVEALRFETFEDSALAHFLLELSFKDRRFAFEIYWQLQLRIDHCPYNDFSANAAAYMRRCQLLQTELLERHENGTLCHDVCSQHRLLNTLDELQRELRKTEESNKLSYLGTRLGLLDSSLLSQNVRIPMIPSFKCSGIEVAKCNIFNSNAKPLKIVFKGLKRTLPIIHKDGDDMRQDALVLQMVRLMNDVWLGEQLDLKMITFRCMPVGYKKGMAELVGDCSTLCDIQKAQGVGGVFKDDILCKWLERYNSTEFLYRMALDNFQRSCAGWCVATYVLGIGDRHNDNILLTTMGHVFHIDFGKYMGDWQMAGAFKRDRVPFVFTKEMYFVINGGQLQSCVTYQTFIDHCCRAFNSLRKKHFILTNLIKIMACSDIPGININSLHFVEKNLMLELSDTDATTQFTQLITCSLKSAFPRLNFLVHTLAQFMNSAGSTVKPAEANQGLSFIPHRYTKDTDGRIKAIRVSDVEKHMMPQKVYLYKIVVTREQEAVETTVYRSSAEFHELYLALLNRFPALRVPPLSKTWAMRSNVREVAQRRMIDIKLFLECLMRLPNEISHCDLVYTFFHLILRDSSLENGIEDQASVGGECQINLRITWDAPQKQLKAFVSHVKHLPILSTGQPPDAYVKTYIRPDDAYTVNSKRKTHIVRQSINPTFNAELSYQLSAVYDIEDFLTHHMLDVSVWNSGGLKDNQKMYLLFIPLSRLQKEPADRKGTRVLQEWFSLTRVGPNT